MAKSVTLIAPGGGKVTVTDAVSISSLVYGSGYKVDGSKTVDQAIASLSEGPASAVKPADQAKADEEAKAKRG